MRDSLPVVVGITGASGALYADRLLRHLGKAKIPSPVVASKWGRYLLNHELGLELGKSPQETLRARYGPHLTWQPSTDMSAGIASGTHKTQGMVIIPCSMGSLGHIAHGVTANLLHRAADVTIKEGRPLVVVPRETPLSPIHLENLLTLSRFGATIVDANPTFYQGVESVEDLVDSVVARVLDALGIVHSLLPPWGLPTEISKDA
ncbi:UbiX family flavin prenyltransferase [bacterium]|nr:UbiX family flavin prenyltransferase [bacterium]